MGACGDLGAGTPRLRPVNTETCIMKRVRKKPESLTVSGMVAARQLRQLLALARDPEQASVGHDQTIARWPECAYSMNTTACAAGQHSAAQCYSSLRVPTHTYLIPAGT